MPAGGAQVAWGRAAQAEAEEEQGQAAEDGEVDGGADEALGVGGVGGGLDQVDGVSEGG